MKVDIQASTSPEKPEQKYSASSSVARMCPPIQLFHYWNGNNNF
jgi:hypothetical protein